MNSLFLFLYAMVLFVPPVLMIVSLWIVFSKAGHGGWKIFIPVYNLYVLFDIAGDTSGFWATLSLNIISNIIMAIVGAVTGGFRVVLAIIVLILSFISGVILIKNNFRVAESFGKGTGFGFLLWLVPIVGYPILAFSRAEHYTKFLQTNT